MQAARFAILDPAAGISGDMLLGALLDVGAPPDWLLELPGRLGLPGVELEESRVRRCGISCAKVTVRLADGAVEGPSLEYTGPHHHDPTEGDGQGHGSGPHRHLPELLRLIERAPFSRAVREQASRTFRLICEAEGAVHGVPAEHVALHEVGALDALVDVVGSLEGFERLGIDRVYTRPVAVGTGWVRTSHGDLPAPAPATVRLLEGLEIGPNGPVTGEAVTPTGAALLRVLSAGSPPPRWRLTRSGWGAGSRDPAHYPNALRLLIAEPAPEAGMVVTLSTDLDDLNPEYLEPLREALEAAGALDVQVWSTHMKKGRPGFRVEVLADPAAADRVTEALFLHSTTSGIRRAVTDRVTLPRRQIEVEASGGFRVRVKVVETPRGPRVKPEFDDVRAVARQTGRPAMEIAREVEGRARSLVVREASGDPPDREEQE
jgi:uncharacterized protein (TIGR00299 family) protein